MKKKNTFLRVGLVLTALVVGFIVLAFSGRPYSPNAMDFSRLLPPSAAHPMGTDKFGRDILSRVMVGAGDTLLIALGTVAIGTVVGTLVGALTGWYGGWVDEVLMRLNDALASFPSILILARAREPARRRARAHDACARHRLCPKLRAYRAQRIRPRAHAELRPFGGADGRVHRAHPLCSHSAEHLAHARLRHHHRL